MGQPVAAWASSMLHRAFDLPPAERERRRPLRFPARPDRQPAAHSPAAAPALKPPVPAPFPMHMKTQYSGDDVRAERLVRLVRDELKDVRATVAALRDERAEMLEVDIEAVRADPAAAASLPAAVLVRALLAEASRHDETRDEVMRRDERVQEVHGELRQAQQENAWLQGRLHTFEETLGALHANLEDLRQLRDAAPHHPHLLDVGGSQRERVEPAAPSEPPALVRPAPRARKRPA